MDRTECNILTSYPFYKKESLKAKPKVFYKKLASEFMKFLVNKVLQGEEITIPGRLGTLSLVGTKAKLAFNKQGVPVLPPDWVRTKILWDRSPEAKERKQLVFHLNEETSGVRYRFCWTRKRVALQNKNIYSLRMTRENKRAAHDLIKAGKEYIIKDRY